MNVHHLAVVVADLERAEAFYAGVLGLPVIRRLQDAEGAPRAVWVGLGDAFLAIEKAGAPGPTRSDLAPGWHFVALGIAPGEREGWRVKLATAGHPLVRETDFTIYVRDPDGNLVGFSHYPHGRVMQP